METESMSLQEGNRNMQLQLFEHNTCCETQSIGKTQKCILVGVMFGESAVYHKLLGNIMH